MDVTYDNSVLKRDVNRFCNRFFNTKDKSIENLAYMYYLLEDFIAFAEDELCKVGNELLEKDFKKVYLQDINKKVWLDDECGILIDDISSREKENLQRESNEAYVKATVKV